MKALVFVGVEVEIDVEDEVVRRVVDNVDDWQGKFYAISTVEQVFEHLAYNVVVNNASLSMLDGWADLPADAMQTRELSVYMTATVEG